MRMNLFVLDVMLVKLRRLDAMSKLGSMRIFILAIFSCFKEMTLVSPDPMKVVSEIDTASSTFKFKVKEPIDTK